MAFTDKTRRKIIPLGAQGFAGAGIVGGGTFTWDIPKTGLLAGIYVNLAWDTDATGGTWAAESVKGAADALINRVRLIANSGIDLVNLDGAGLILMHYFQESYNINLPAIDTTWGGEAAIAPAGTGNINFFLPVSINRRDPLGMFMLQNESTLLQLQIVVNNGTIAGGAGSLYDSVAITPWLEIFTVPNDPKDWPPLNVVHQIVQETRTVAAGWNAYRWPRGNTYAQVIHALDTGAVTTDFSDNFTGNLNLTVNQSDVVYQADGQMLDMEYVQTHGIPRHAGYIPFDFLGTSGLGTFGSARDMLYSAMVTEINTNINVTAAGQLYTVRRQLVALK